jgi:hypothetical protein
MKRFGENTQEKQGEPSAGAEQKPIAPARPVPRNQGQNEERGGRPRRFGH